MKKPEISFEIVEVKRSNYSSVNLDTYTKDNDSDRRHFVSPYISVGSHLHNCQISVIGGIESILQYHSNPQYDVKGDAFALLVHKMMVKVNSIQKMFLIDVASTYKDFIKSSISENLINLEAPYISSNGNNRILYLIHNKHYGE